MNYDDRYHPSNNNDVDNSKYNSFMDDVKKLDSGYNEIYRKVVVESKGISEKKNKKVIVYNSGGVGSHIRNAITGVYTKSVVGSRDEDLYFSFILATGELRRGAITLFFDSPDQCETHLRVELGSQIKTKWNNRRLKNLL